LTPKEVRPVETEPSVESSQTVAGVEGPRIESGDAKKPTEVDFEKVRANTKSPISEEEFKELSQWLNNRGYFSVTEKGEYEGYSDEALNGLAKQGDLKALNVATTRAISKGDHATAVRMMNTAIVYGSTAELDGLALLTAPNPYKSETPAQMRESALETLALTKVLEMRGDKSLAAVSKRGFEQSYKRQFGNDFQPTEDEVKLIDERSKEIYNSYQEIRRSIGLGDFDNSTPAAADRFFGSSK
jgi:hypothetical protein